MIRRGLSAEDRVQARTRPSEICDARSGTGRGFSSSTSVIACQYHSTTAPYAFIHLPPTLCNVFLPVLQFSPVSIIPPLLHTHSFIYHPRSIIFFSQYFSFPCQYHSTITPYSFIHLPPTLYNVFLPVLQFPPSVSFHQLFTLVNLCVINSI